MPGPDRDECVQSWRAICLNLVGRGRSDWLQEPEDYDFPQWAANLTMLIARLDVALVGWIGAFMEWLHTNEADRL